MVDKRKSLFVYHRRAKGEPLNPFCLYEPLTTASLRSLLAALFIYIRFAHIYKKASPKKPARKTLYRLGSLVGCRASKTIRLRPILSTTQPHKTRRRKKQRHRICPVGHVKPLPNFQRLRFSSAITVNFSGSGSHFAP